MHHRNLVEVLGLIPFCSRVSEAVIDYNNFLRRGSLRSVNRGLSRSLDFPPPDQRRVASAQPCAGITRPSMDQVVAHTETTGGSPTKSAQEVLRRMSLNSPPSRSDNPRQVKRAKVRAGDLYCGSTRNGTQGSGNARG